MNRAVLPERAWDLHSLGVRAKPSEKEHMTLRVQTALYRFSCRLGCCSLDRRSSCRHTSKMHRVLALSRRLGGARSFGFRPPRRPADPQSVAEDHHGSVDAC